MANISILVFGVILGFVVKSFISSYSSEKGKNLATKEDVKEITRKVEEVKIEFSKDLEIVKWELTKKAALHRLVAEKEIAAISEIGYVLFDLKVSTNSLRPIADYLPHDEAEKKQTFHDRFVAWTEKHNLFLTAVENTGFFFRVIYIKVFR